MVRLLSLATRLFVALAALIVVAEFGFGWWNARLQEDRLVETVVEGGARLSQSVTSATWHAMLADRREDAYAVLRAVGKSEGIERIRLFDGVGRVAFSTDAPPWDAVPQAAQPCAACHEGSRLVARPDAPRRTRIVEENGHRRLGVVTAIYNEPACSAAACHAHPASKEVLGVLDVTMDLTEVDAAVAQLRDRTVLLVCGEMAVIGAAVLVLTHVLIRRPVRELVRATKAIGGMRLDAPVVVRDETELGQLARAFEGMRVRLRDTLGQLEEARRDLEAKVEERTRQLRDAQGKLIQSDRLASLGQLAGVVAHEINNPLSAVLNLSVLTQRILKDGGVPAGREDEVREYLRQIASETARAARIVQDLLAFSRRAKPQRVPSDLNAVVRRTLAIVKHKLDLSRAELRLDLAEGLPAVECDPAQVEQVVLNLAMNAAESMPKGGPLVVRTSIDAAADAVVLEVTDAGAGIAPEHLEHVFEPFFTTKEAGKGVGLGLAVVYGIVDAHRGAIDVTSALGKGTTFRVSLPLHPALAAQPTPEPKS